MVVEKANISDFVRTCSGQVASTSSHGHTTQQSTISLNKIEFQTRNEWEWVRSDSFFLSFENLNNIFKINLQSLMLMAAEKSFERNQLSEFLQDWACYQRQVSISQWEISTCLVMSVCQNMLIFRLYWTLAPSANNHQSQDNTRLETRDWLKNDEHLNDANKQEAHCKTQVQMISPGITSSWCRQWRN